MPLVNGNRSSAALLVHTPFVELAGFAAITILETPFSETVVIRADPTMIIAMMEFRPRIVGDVPILAVNSLPSPIERRPPGASLVRDVTKRARHVFLLAPEWCIRRNTNTTNH